MRFSGLLQLFRGQKPSERELLVMQMPSREVDLPKAVQSVVHFAETKQIIDQIYHMQSDRKVKSLAILSEIPREGRSLFSATLALGFGQLVRKKVLVVDCHTVRGPYSLSLERLLEADELADDARDDDVRKTLSANVSLLRLRDWAEQRDAMAEYEVQNLVDGPGKHSDLVIFDTCAMGIKNRNNLDPIAIARRCDAAILVVSKRSGSRGMLYEIRERLRKEKLEVLGVVHNEGILV